MLNNVKSNTIVSFGTELQLGGKAVDLLLKSDFPNNSEGESFDKLNKIRKLDNLRIQLANDAFQKDKVLIYATDNAASDNLTLILYRSLNAEKVCDVELRNIPTNKFFAEFNNNLLNLRGKIARKLTAESNQQKFQTILEKYIPSRNTNP